MAGFDATDLKAGRQKVRPRHLRLAVDIDEMWVVDTPADPEADPPVEEVGHYETNVTGSFRGEGPYDDGTEDVVQASAQKVLTITEANAQKALMEKYWPKFVTLWLGT